MSIVRHSYLTFWAGRLLHLPIAEAISVWPNAQQQKVKVTEGYINGCEAEIYTKAES